MKRVVVAVALLMLPLPVLAQTAATKAAQAQFDMIKGNLSKAAAKVPEDLYAFRPAPDVRTFGQIVRHIADANVAFCAAAAEETAPPVGFLNGKTSKADIAKALQESITYCDTVIATLDDAKGAAVVPFPPAPDGQMPKLSIVHFAIAHGNEHYGNLVTYMRLKGIVPPSSVVNP